MRFRKIVHSKHLSELLGGGPIFVRSNIGKQNGLSDGPNVGLGEAVEGLSPAGPLG